jgi:hypothetical protein
MLLKADSTRGFIAAALSSPGGNNPGVETNTRNASLSSSEAESSLLLLLDELPCEKPRRVFNSARR